MSEIYMPKVEKVRIRKDRGHGTEVWHLSVLENELWITLSFFRPGFPRTGSLVFGKSKSWGLHGPYRMPAETQLQRVGLEIARQIFLKRKAGDLRFHRWVLSKPDPVTSSPDHMDLAKRLGLI